MLRSSLFSVLMISLISGSLVLSVSSSSWFILWVSLELNTLSFLGLVSVNEKGNYESSVKYFLVQSSASFLFLLSSLVQSANIDMTLLMLFSVLIKGGAAPMHFWVPAVASGMSWGANLILLTIQKIIPLTIISLLFSIVTEPVFWMASVLSCAVGGFMGWNELNLRKLLSFSSINHMGWMVACSALGPSMWVTYFLVYSILSLGLFDTLRIKGLGHVSEVMSKSSWNWRLLVSLLFLSLSGLPPMTGFFPKWLALEAGVEVGMSILFYVLISLSVILLSYYLRVILGSVMQLDFSEESYEVLSGLAITHISLATLGGLLVPCLVSSSLQYFLLW